MERFQVVGVGYSCVDMICMVEDFPVEDSSTHITSRVIQGGGAVATALVAASKLGTKCAFVGNIGNDIMSDETIRMFEAYGVCTDHMVRRDDCYGLESIVMVNPENGSRTKFPQRDYNPPITWDDRLTRVIEGCNVLHLDGTHYENAVNAARIAKDCGVLVSLDGCSMQKDNEKNKILATMADILIMNSKYPLRVSGKATYDEALLEMSTWGSKKVVGCTLGDKGSKFVVDGRVVDFPSFKAKSVVDTTGCGDVFHGAFLSAYVSEMTLDKCIRFASATACCKCAVPGGRAGVITKFIKTAFGITIPNIYGFNGILLVLSLKLFPLVFMYVSGAMKNVDKSLLEASANMGVSGVKRFFSVVIPLCMPSILAATLMVFMRAIADFGTPLMIGEGYTTFPVIIYNEYVGEVGTNHNFAAAISVVAILITLVFFLVQRYLTKKNSFSMSAMNHVERKKAKPLANFFIHLYGYGLVAVALLPQLYLVYLSFRKTNPSGEVFQEGFSLQSYQYVFSRMGNTIWNTIRICGLALILIIVLAILISYLTVRRRNFLNATIDTLSMVPYVIPGAVVGISMILAFNNPYLPLVGTAAIMVIAMCVRRIPYTIRSSVAILSQIPLSIDEAAESLGAGKLKTLVRITIPMMFNGIFAGAIMSWVTLITELSSSMLLYSFRTQTLNIAVYKAVANATDGRACALATVVSIFTVISLLLFNRVSKDGEIMM